MKKYLLPLILTLILISGVNCFATAWDIGTASYDEVFKAIGTEEIDPYGLAFSFDGSKMYIVGYATDTVYQYTLGTPWNVGTAGDDEASKAVGTQDISPRKVTFNSDGLKMYILGYTNNTIYQYALSEAWNIGTANYASIFKTVTEDEYPHGLDFSSDGSKMYVLFRNTDTVHQYTLSEAWNVGTASYDEVFKSIITEDTNPTGLTFSSDGSKMYMVGFASDYVYQYTLSEAWNVGTASYDEISKAVGTEDGIPTDVTFGPDGFKMYIIGRGTDTVYQYTMPEVGWDHKWNTQTISKWNTKEIIKWNALE